MPFTQPSRLEEALAVLAEHEDVTVLAGGTDLMVEINEGHRRPAAHVLAVDGIAELRSWRHDPVEGAVHLGAGITYTELLQPPLAALLPALAQAARTVGSPQIRNVGTIGGNLATCSPAGDTLPVLAALAATVHVQSPGGARDVPVGEFMVGVKRTVLDRDELITGITLPTPAGAQGFAKVGVRNAMVIAVANACVVLDRAERRVGVAIGSAGPTVLRCRAAEAHLMDRLDWGTLIAGADDLRGFAELVTAAAQPITDHRSTADYRRHAVGVLARRIVERLAVQETAA
jgi:CO/xanthine dehydrogenase FAD-binding subunit